MIAEWFPDSFSLETARKHIVINVYTKSGDEIRETVAEYDSEFTPLMLFRAVSVFGEYEIDYDVILHNELRKGLKYEMLFTAVSIAYLSHMTRGTREHLKWYVRDYLSEDSFNSLCDDIRGYFHSIY